MVKNDKYWNADNVDIQKIEARIVKELETAVNLYESGQLDDTEIDSEYVDEYRGTPDFYSQTFFATFYMVFNYRDPIFQNENIRRAFQIGFDRAALAKQILNNGSEPADGYVPEGMNANGGNDETFREAQGPSSPSSTPRRPRVSSRRASRRWARTPPSSCSPTTTARRRDIATFLQEQFEKMGAKINVKVQPFDRKLELEANGEFQLSWQGWIGDYNDPMTFLDLWLSDASFNTRRYKNPRYDELITQAQEEPDAAARMDMLLEAERLMVEEDAACAPMFYDGEVRLVRPTITNYVDHPYGGGKDISLWKLKG